MTAPLLETRTIRKEFGNVIANRDIDFSLDEGEVHSILGENGAGKSTFMKLLYGVYQQDQGDILIHGESYDPDSPSDALNHGIGLVYQEFKLIEPFSVLDNITLGLAEGSMFGDDTQAHRERIATLSRELDLGLEDRLDWRVSELSEGEKQRTEILKILYRDVDILLLDEPTSILTPQEVNKLFEVIMTLVEEEGLGVVLITHKLDEAMEISDRITVLRDGEVVGKTVPKDTDQVGLAKMMVGREDVTVVEEERIKHDQPETILNVDGITVHNARDQTAVDDVSIAVNRGEIYGVVGVEGNGQQELVRTLAGLETPKKGTITFDGEDITGSSRKTLRNDGLLLIPDSHGIIEEFEIPDDCILDDYEKYYDNWLVDEEQTMQAAQDIVEEYSVKIPSMNATASQLSGGNKQKIVVGRKLANETRRLIIAVNPTKGLDVDTKRFIHDKLVQERNEGRTVLLVTTDLEEARSVSDRLATINDGRIVQIFDEPKTANKQEMGLAMTGSESQ